MSGRRRIRGLFVGAQIATGLGLVAFALVIRLWFSLHPLLAAMEGLVLSAGLVILLLAVFPARRLESRLPLGLCVAVMSTVATLAAGEVFFRLIGFDFHGQEAALNRVPPYYREPRTPTGEVFFRRNGPEEWTGQVIRTWMVETWWPGAETYEGEPIVTVRYDRNGFRNEVPMDDWEIAVAGDSFTELGYLPYEDLFTTRLGRELGCRVLNLGVSQTGAFSQLSYLRDYGLSESLEQTVIVFFEGNDLYDINREHEDLVRYEETGERPWKRIEKQTSLLRAIGELISGVDPSPVIHRPPPARYLFESGDGIVPVTLIQVAPSVTDVSAAQLAQLDRFYREYRRFGAEHGVRTWLAYMPCKARVLYDRLTPEDGTALEDFWRPTALPDLIREGCERHGIDFIDLTPVLTEAARDRGELVYNPIVDTHLNARGAELVAGELARRLRATGPEVSGEVEPATEPALAGRSGR